MLLPAIVCAVMAIHFYLLGHKKMCVVMSSMAFGAALSVFSSSLSSNMVQMISQAEVWKATGLLLLSAFLLSRAEQ